VIVVRSRRGALWICATATKKSKEREGEEEEEVRLLKIGRLRR
jgi:hypothetical protein